MANGDFFFHDWTDYNVVSFSIDLLEWGAHFLIFGVRQLFILTVSKPTHPPARSPLFSAC